MRHHSGYVVALLGILSVPAMAQQGSTLGNASIADARVRVTMASHEQVTGTVIALRADTVVLETSPTGATRGLARTEVARVERSAGTRRYLVRGATIGFLAGATVGALMGHSVSNDVQAQCPKQEIICIPVNGLAESFGTATGAITGGVLGASIGLLIGMPQHEQWRQVVGDGGVRVGFGPAPGKRLALSVSLRR